MIEETAKALRELLGHIEPLTTEDVCDYETDNLQDLAIESDRYVAALKDVLGDET